VALQASDSGDGGPVRSPRLRVLAGGALMEGVVGAEVLGSNNYAADRFHVTAALGGDPVRGAAWWAAAAPVEIDVQMSLDGIGWTSVVQGSVDVVELDPVCGVLHLEGRDLTSLFLEAQAGEVFANRTAGEIAEMLARRHGLAADVMPTATPVGRYWELEHDRLMLNAFGSTATEWDLLVMLARAEGFDVWVADHALHFRPQAQKAAPGCVLRATQTALGPPNVTALRMERSLTMAGAIEVTVKSWHSRLHQAVVQTARNRSPNGQSLVQRRVYVMPNLMPAEALKVAQRRLAELGRQAQVITVDMPGELSLAPRQQFRLEGTGTDFDQVYVVDEIERRLHMQHGFSQRLRARCAMNGSEDAWTGS
jgi:phage protein D